MRHRTRSSRKVNAYEIGFKGSTSDRSLSVAVAIFRADYTDLQIQANRSDPATGTVLFVQTNAGSSRTQGVEVDATLRPSDRFSVNAAVTYADASIDIDGLNCPLQFQGTAPILTGGFPVNSCYRSQRPNAAGALVTSGPIQDIRNGQLPGAPRWRITVGPRFDTPVSDNLNVFVQGNLNFQSAQNFAVEQDPLLVQPAYTLVDLSVGVHDASNRFTATLFVKNLFDVNYFSTLAHGTFLVSAASPNDVFANFNKDSNRYIGGSLSFRFR